MAPPLYLRLARPDKGINPLPTWRHQATETEQLILPGLAGCQPASFASPPARRVRAKPLSTATAFLADRASSLWDAGQPSRGHDTVSGRIGAFHPSQISEMQWERIGPHVRRYVEVAAPASATRAATLLNTVTQFLLWCDGQGLDLGRADLFRPEVVEQFAATGCGHLSTGTRANYRSHLRTVGECVLGPAACPGRTPAIRASDPEAPYSHDELGALLGWARGLITGARRHNALALLALGAGAGLASSDIAALVGTDVHVDAEGVLIEVPRGKIRRVPVLRAWEEPVAELAAQCGQRPLFRPDRDRISRRDINRFVERCHPAYAPKLSTQRLRVTWLVHHLTAGTPAPALLEAAGIGPLQLARYMRFVPAPNRADSRRFLREADTP